MRRTLPTLLVSIIVGTCVPGAWALEDVDAAASVRPNLLMVFIDDMGWSDLSCFGGTRTRTQHIDRLADEGIRFTNFYVNSPICSPSRVALTTGQYPQRWRITSYLSNRADNERRGMDQWLDPSAPVLARELQRAGYATGHFGKWHMGGQRDVGEAPLISAYGFARSLTNFEGLGPRVLPLCDAYDGRPPRRHGLGSGTLGHGPIRWLDRSVVTAAFVEDAISFIDDARTEGRPFYINLWPDDVHSPFFPPEGLRDETNESKRALYYAVLDAMDEQLGLLFDRIREDDDLRDNTLILVASDNGHEEGAGSSAPLRGAKTWLYEGGIRSPLIAWGPGLIQATPGTVNRTSVFCALDLNRSLYTIAGVPPPPGATLDGEDVSTTLLGASSQGRQAPICWRRPPERPGSSTHDNPDLAIRDGNWKFLVDFDGAHPQLYDLQADLSETTNLASQHPDIVARLHRTLQAWHTAMPPDAGPTYPPTPAPMKSLAANRFVNPIAEGADPWVIRDPHHRRYLWCLSDGNRAISIHTGERLTSLGPGHIVWRAPDQGPVSREIWAPELHFLDGHWHIYFAASDGDNANHRAYVLRSASADPLGDYTLHGPLATGDGNDGLSPNHWAIDVTVLEHAGRRYAVWSGWDEAGSDRQYLYAAPMRSPTELAGPRVRLCANDDFPWELTEASGAGRGLNEAPQVMHGGGRTFLTFSCGASWLSTYKLGLLALTGDDPLDPNAWTKHDRPVFASTRNTYGVGHSCVVPSPDGSEWWHVYHAKRDREPGWRRAIQVQPMRFDPEGFPVFDRPVAPGVPLALPAGELPPTLPFPFASTLQDRDGLAGLAYYGHHQFIHIDAAGLHLGRIPDHAINEYRSGEKILLGDAGSVDFTAEVTLHFRGDPAGRDAGILFRTTAPAVGYDAQRGYFAGLIPATGLIIFGKTDGTTWTELARAEADPIDPAQPQKLQVTTQGKRVEVLHNGRARLLAVDDSYDRGAVGLRVVNTHAVFSNFTLQPLDNGLASPPRIR